MSLIPIEQSYAYISLDGIIIGNNKLFSDICGISYQNLYKLKLISLARFSIPEEFMQSAYLLDLLVFIIITTIISSINIIIIICYLNDYLYFLL